MRHSLASTAGRSWRALGLGLGASALLLAACGSSPSSSGGGPTSSTTTTAPPTTAAPSCPSFGSTAARSSSAVAVTRVPPIALLRNVQVQASDCVDAVSFLFWGGMPGWSVSYRSGPLSLDPSGKTVAVEGAAHLVVRFAPASGVNLSRPSAALIYDGPTEIHPPAPSGLRELRQLGDFEAVTSWVVGLPTERPFQVATSRDHLVISFPAPSPRASRCLLASAGVSVGYPARWYAELSPRWACRFFAPHPFAVLPATDAVNWTVTVRREPRSAQQVVSDAVASGSVVQRSTTTVAGYKATVLDITESGQAMAPAGSSYRMYVVWLGSNALVLQSTAARPNSALAQFNKAAVDRIAQLVERR